MTKLARAHFDYLEKKLDKFMKNITSGLREDVTNELL